MPFLKAKKTFYDEIVQNLFCGEEMKPFVAYPRGEEESRPAPKPETEKELSAPAPLSRGRRIWNRITGVTETK